MPRTIIPLTAGFGAPVLAAWLYMACGDRAGQGGDGQRSVRHADSTRLEKALRDWMADDANRIVHLTLAELREAPEGLHRAIYDRCVPERKLVLWQEKLNDELASGTLTPDQEGDVVALKALLQVDHFARGWTHLPPAYTQWMATAHRHFDAPQLQRITGTLLGTTPSTAPATAAHQMPQPVVQTCPCSNSQLEQLCKGSPCSTSGGCAVTRTGCGFLGFAGCDGWCR